MQWYDTNLNTINICVIKTRGPWTTVLGDSKFLRSIFYVWIYPTKREVLAIMPLQQIRQKIQITYTVFDHMYLLHKVTGLTNHLQRQQTYTFLSRFIPSRKHKVFEFLNNFPCSFCHSLIIWHWNQYYFKISSNDFMVFWFIKFLIFSILLLQQMYTRHIPSKVS